MACEHFVSYSVSFHCREVGQNSGILMFHIQLPTTSALSLWASPFLRGVRDHSYEFISIPTCPLLLPGISYHACSVIHGISTENIWTLDLFLVCRSDKISTVVINNIFCYLGQWLQLKSFYVEVEGVVSLVTYLHYLNPCAPSGA
jgi:hypothetical protein